MDTYISKSGSLIFGDKILFHEAWVGQLLSERYEINASNYGLGISLKTYLVKFSKNLITFLKKKKKKKDYQKLHLCNKT